MPIAGEPPRRDLMLWRGDEDPPVVWIFGNAGMPEFFDGATFLLIVQWGLKPTAGALPRGPLLTTGELTLSSEDDTLAVDAAEQTVSWMPTLAEFAAIPFGAPVRYELKRIIAGKARTSVWGEVKIGSGLLRAPEETPGPIGQSYTDIRIATLRSELLTAIAAVEAGQGGGQAQLFPVAMPVSGHRGVRLSSGHLLTTTVTEVSQADTCFGITAGGGAAGASVEVCSGGLMDEASWSWAPGPIFLGLDGMLTQAPPRAAFEQRVGFAVGPTTMLVAIEPAIISAT